MKPYLLIALVLMGIATTVFSEKEPPLSEASGKRNDPVYISILSLIANPEKWDKKKICFSGYGLGGLGDTVVVSYAHDLLGKNIPTDKVIVRGNDVPKKASLMRNISPSPLFVTVIGTVEVGYTDNGGIRGIFINTGSVDFEDTFETYSRLFEK